VSPFLRKVRTASGTMAVQIAVKEDGVRRIVEHLGSTHDEASSLRSGGPGSHCLCELSSRSCSYESHSESVAVKRDIH